MVAVLFDEEAITDNDEHVSETAIDLGNTGKAKALAVEIGCTSNSISVDNRVTAKLQISSDYYSYNDPDTYAHWADAPPDVFRPINILVGESYSIGILGSGDEFKNVQLLPEQTMRARFVVQRHEIDGAGTNTITVNAWVTD